MSAGKLTNIELRAQEERGDQMDSCRNLTNFLNHFQDYSIDYLVEGVRRLAQSWVESRKIAPDMESSEFEAAWEKIRKEGFSHAFHAQQGLADQARQLCLEADVVKVQQTIKKFKNVFRKPTEAGQLLNY